MRVNGKSRVCAIIGNPVDHSLSPVMHNAAFKELRLNLVYVAFKVTSGELETAVLGAKSLGLQGLNITMPHKQAVMKYLDEVDVTAKSVGAVNTVLCKNGKLIGYNTDGRGAISALQENGVYTEEKKMVILGAGGAAKAIAYQASQDLSELVILNRTHEKAKKLAESIKSFGVKVKIGTLSHEIMRTEMPTTDILVNATSLGMHPKSGCSPVPSDILRSDLCVMDIIYNPLDTQLAKDAKAKGAKVVSGLEMLIYQGAVAFEIWTNYPAPIEVMRKAALKELKK
jgi:shikimate dehydrogenase